MTNRGERMWATQKHRHIGVWLPDHRDVAQRARVESAHSFSSSV